VEKHTLGERKRDKHKIALRTEPTKRDRKEEKGTRKKLVNGQARKRTQVSNKKNFTKHERHLDLTEGKRRAEKLKKERLHSQRSGGKK